MQNNALCFDFFFEQVTTSTDGPPTIQNVLLCGENSRNGYKIPKTAFSGPALYESKPVYLDHNTGAPLSRSVRDLAGVVTNARMDESGRPRGDIRCYDTEPGRLLYSLAKEKAQGVGMSHVAFYRFNEDKTAVEEITEVVSVDAVCRPATTSSFVEHTKGDQVDPKVIEELRAARDAAIAKTAVVEAELAALKQANAALETEATAAKSEIAGLKASVEKYQAAEALAARATAILTEAKNAGLDVSDSVAFSEAFKSQLLSVAAEGQRKELIADRLAMVERAKGTTQYQATRRNGASADFDPAKALEELLNG